ncbi:MAG: alpha/beta fold hydrolase [Planctomycetes bacterium]|nr:alpha/beta fold hydrolase [Planctomycetota bacterium]
MDAETRSCGPRTGPGGLRLRAAGAVAWSPGRRRALRCGALLAALGALALAWAGCVSRAFLYPDRDLDATPAEYGMAYEDLRIPVTGRESLHAWWVSAPGTARAAFLLSHGNAGDVADFLPWVRMLHETGCSVLAYDYRGYGRSDGRPRTHGLMDDARAAWTHLVSRPDAPAGRLGLYGVSLGTTVTLALAREQPEAVRAVVLEGAFIPREELYRKFPRPLAWLFLGAIPPDLDTRTQAAGLAAPKLFVHSERDRVTSLEGARALYAAAAPPKEIWVVPGRDHMEPIHTDPEAYRARLERFLAEVWGE